MLDHATVLAALRAEVHHTLRSALAVASAATSEASHAESKAENQYDTRGLEASYLAAGQAVRVTALRRLASFFDGLGEGVRTEDAVVGLGALVALDDGRGPVRWCFVAPDGGGISVQVQGVEVQVVTQASPLGEVLVGASAGDVVERLDPRPQALTVLSVSMSS